jgi:hypothetical protein
MDIEIYSGLRDFGRLTHSSTENPQVGQRQADHGLDLTVLDILCRPPDRRFVTSLRVSLLHHVWPYHHSTRGSPHTLDVIPTFPQSNGREGSRRIHRSMVHVTSLLHSSGVLALLSLYSPEAVNVGLTTS